MNSKNVLVTDGFWRKSLAVVRALSRSGLKAGVGERTLLAPALFSKHARWRYIYPSVELYPERFLDWLERLARQRKFAVLIVPEEETSLLIARNKERFASFIKIALPEYEAMKFLGNKFTLISHAKKVGIPCPVTQLITSEADFLRYKSQIQFPQVLKPINSSGGRGIEYIFHQSELEAGANKILAKYKEFLMQEYIPGDSYYGVSTIFNDRNEMRSVFVHQKIRQYPPTGGASTYAVSVKFPRLVELTESLLKSLRWRGVANVEFKIDRRDGSPRLMEANPRLWGSLQLAITSGINIPQMLYQLAIDGDTKPVFDYKTGVKFRWFLHGDAMHFLYNLSRLRRNDPNILKLLERQNCHAIWSLSDPLPALGNILSLLDFIASKEMRKYHG
jgi:predicted ATP-grasp superfamily ATP-dependent carboligase